MSRNYFIVWHVQSRGSGKEVLKQVKVLHTVCEGQLSKEDLNESIRTFQILSHRCHCKEFLESSELISVFFFQNNLLLERPILLLISTSSSIIVNILQSLLEDEYIQLNEFNSF